MKHLNVFYKVMQSACLSSCRGQLILEVAITLPIFLALFTGAYDFGRLLYTKHRIAQAAYEGTKIVPQVSDPYPVYCGNPDCLNQAMITRAKRVLFESGIDMTRQPEPQFVCASEPDDKNPNLLHELVGIHIAYQYSFLFGRAALLGVKTIPLDHTAWVYRTPLEEGQAACLYIQTGFGQST